MAAPMSTLSTFASWISSNKSWDDLKAWLQANEPTIEVLDFEDYAILRNNKDRVGGEAAVAEDAVSEGAQLCRSVVWNKALNVPCSVAPFAARRDQKIPMDVALRLEDFVEGVMVNIFRVRGDNETHVSTRSRLDADGTFYSDRSFRELFEEAMDAKQTSLDDIENLIGAPSDDVAATFITMVLAHPEHRVVRTVSKANLWAVYRGTVANDGTVTFYTEDLPLEWRPKTYSLTFKPADFGELKAKFDEIKTSKPWYWQGLVVHNGLQRWRFRNGDHDRVRKNLRGMESNALARFLRLRANRKIQEYLRIYPEDNEVFQGFEQDYRGFTRNLYAWYCKVHKEHGLPFKSLPKSVQPLVFDLHKFYLGTLRPENKTLRMAETIEWIANYLKTPFGVPNMLRFSRESEEAPQVARPHNEREVKAEGDSLQISIDASPLPVDDAESIGDDAL